MSDDGAPIQQPAEWIPQFRPGEHGPAPSYRKAAWGGLKDGVVKVDSTNRPNAIMRVLVPNLQVVERAVEILVQRHPVLNCRIEERLGEPWLVPCESLRPQIALIRHEGGPTEEHRRDAERLIGNFVWSKFDVLQGPLYRAYAVQFGQREFYVGLVVHHFVADGASIQILMEELRTLYEALIVGQSPSLRPPGVNYQGYLSSIRQWIESEAGQKRLDAAVERLKDIPKIDLSGLVNEEDFDEETFEIDQNIADNVHEAARKFRVSPFTLLLAAQLVFLRPFSSSENVALKVITNGREASALNRTVGNLADRMMVLTDLSGDPTSSDIIERVKMSLSWARTHIFVRHDFVLSDPRAAGLSLAAPVFNFRSVRASSSGAPSASPDGQTWRPLKVPPASTPPTLPRDAYYMVLFDDGKKMWGNVRYGSGRINGFLPELQRILSIICDRPHTSPFAQ